LEVVAHSIDCAHLLIIIDFFEEKTKFEFWKLCAVWVLLPMALMALYFCFLKERQKRMGKRM